MIGDITFSSRVFSDNGMEGSLAQLSMKPKEEKEGKKSNEEDEMIGDITFSSRVFSDNRTEGSLAQLSMKPKEEKEGKKSKKKDEIIGGTVFSSQVFSDNGTEGSLAQPSMKPSSASVSEKDEKGGKKKRKRPTRHPTGFSTEKPTNSPTKSPKDSNKSKGKGDSKGGKKSKKKKRKRPTRHPTGFLTEKPTNAPTKSPKHSKKSKGKGDSNPTGFPTKSPTEFPTSSPTTISEITPNPTISILDPRTDSPIVPIKPRIPMPEESEPPTPTTRYLAEQTEKFIASSRDKGTKSQRGEEFKNASKNKDHVAFDTDVLNVDDDNEIDFENDNYFEDIPKFALQNISDPFKCECVDCEEDKICGGIWKGSRYPGDSTGNAKIVHIVVSHCKSDLDWLDDFIGNRTVASIHVITKCGYPVKGAPRDSVIEVLPNVGRCDHTYAYYITTTLPKTVRHEDEDNSVVLFLKDDLSSANMHQHGSWNNFDSMVELASSSNGFACGVIPDAIDFGASRFFLSAYHEVKTLFEFSMDDYARNIKGYSSDNENFRSPYKSLGSWFDSLDAGSPPPIVQVCYGGVFAAAVTNIKRTRMSIWEALEKSLSRANNIQEGHFAERSWAGLISTPLKSFQVDSLLENADGVYLNPSSMHGALLKRPKLYLHVGVQFTTSTELLAESLVEYGNAMSSDGYSIAVHGKWDGGTRGFPNIDNLGACLWPDVDKALFPVYAKDATICPTDLLPDLTSFMELSLKKSKDIVLLNPWLVHPGSAGPLHSYLDPVWDTKVVIYYRRYFEWIASIFEGWRKEIRDNMFSPCTANIPVSTIRFIDFLREHCKRLFYGKDVNEDGFPIGPLSQTAHTTAIIINPISQGSTNGHVYQALYDPETDKDVKELTDLNEYTYFVAKEYNSLPKFRHGITIVNYHDFRGPETNFYCHVLPHARGACKAVLDKDLESYTSETTIPTRKLSSSTPGYKYFPGLEPSKLYEEIVITAYSKGRLKLRATIMDRPTFLRQLSLWMEMIDHALEQKGILVSDFPFECLYPFEVNRLLEVSLEYEKHLLPDFFASPRGRGALEREFRKWRFCSVDTVEILQSRQWDFIFDDALQEQYAIPELPKAYIHVGAPKTGSTSIQDTMSLDRVILREDKYFLALHGQVRESESDGYIQDNMLVKCDRLGNCIWSEDEYNAVCQGTKNERDCKCPKYLLPTFSTFLSNAIANKSGLVISNEWLSRRTSETGLLTILDGWDPIIVLYYRRFYDWMISAHYQWHEDFSLALFEQTEGRIRLIDFFRMFCGRLFSYERGSSGSDGYLSLINLIDIDEYTSEIWKRFHALPEYDEKIKVVNFHKGDVVETFYCDVLDAKKACQTQKDRLATKNTKRTRSKKSTTFIDIAIGMYWENKNNMLHSSAHETTTSNDNDKQPITVKSFGDMADRIKKRLLAKGMNEEDLPRECLSASEQNLLLDFSLAVEKLLLPDDYASGGGDDLRKDFEKARTKNKFCSVDIDKIMRNSQWQFLFDEQQSLFI